jgi:excisionase family DNA binding protein
MENDKLMTTAELAAKLNVSTDTVGRMCTAGKWPYTRIGRLYRFTEEHYQTITATPTAPEPWTRAQRENVARMLSLTPYGRL